MSRNFKGVGIDKSHDECSDVIGNSIDIVMLLLLCLVGKDDGVGTYGKSDDGKGNEDRHSSLEGSGSWIAPGAGMMSIFVEVAFNFHELVVDPEAKCACLWST